MKKTSNIWEYRVGINAIIANFVCKKADLVVHFCILGTEFPLLNAEEGIIFFCTWNVEHLHYFRRWNMFKSLRGEYFVLYCKGLTVATNNFNINPSISGNKYIPQMLLTWTILLHFS